MVDELTQETLSELLRCKPDVLLGNGFSLSLGGDQSLAEPLNFLLNDDLVGEIISDSGISNIEELLFIFEKVTQIGYFKNFHSYFTETRNLLVNAFIKYLSNLQPQSKNLVCAERIDRCVEMLKIFNTRFTLNFDPYLYWIITEDRNYFSDGFNIGSSNQLEWNASNPINNWWLHGALHHKYHANEREEKTFKIKRGFDTNLSQEIRNQIKSGGLPTAILRGTSEEKVRAIRRSPYLRNGLDVLASSTAPILTYGWDASIQDSHILDALSGRNVFFGIHERNSQQGRLLKARVEKFGWTTFDSSWISFWGRGCGYCQICLNNES